MSRFLPTVEEERMASARSRAGLRDRTSTWRGSRLVPRVILFALTLVGVAAFAGLCSLMRLPEELLTAVVAIAVAEALIAGKRLYHAGPEEALWIAGTLALIFSLPGSPSDEALLLVAGAFVISGVRVRNALFLAIAPGVLCVYVAVKSDQHEPAAFLALAIAFAALALVSRQWRDPLIERLCSWLVFAMPLLAYGIDAIDDWRRVSPVRIPLAAGVGLAFLAIGLLRRHRPTVLSGIAALLVAGYEIDRMWIWPLEFRLLVWGALLLVVALLAVRLLRNRRSGVTSEKVEELEGFALAEVAAASVATPHAQAQDPAIGKGGEYGGAGASGEY